MTKLSVCLLIFLASLSEEIYSQPCVRFEPKALSTIYRIPHYRINREKDTVYCLIPRTDSCAEVYPFVKIGSVWTSFYENGAVKETASFKKSKKWWRFWLYTSKTNQQFFMSMQKTGYYSYFDPSGELLCRVFYKNYLKGKVYKTHELKEKVPGWEEPCW